MPFQTDLTKGPVSRLIRQIAVPASIGFFFNTMYNVVDTFYAGKVSTTALAALSISFPIFFIIIALGSGISTGATALISNALGAKRKDEADTFAMQAISFGVIISAILTVVGIVVSPSLFRLLGAEDQYLAISMQYMTIIFYGTVFFVLSWVLNSVLQARGDSRTFRNYLILGFFLNIILDPALLYGWGPFPEMGFAGIAWATFWIQVIGTGYMAYKVQKTGLFCPGCVKNLIPRKKPFIDISKQGFPASLNMMTVALGIFVITFFLARFGKAPVAAYGIATRIEQIVLLPTIGLNMAVLAIVGQNNGAGRFDRIRETLRKSIWYGVLLVAAGYVLVFVWAGWFMDLFTNDAAVIAPGAQYLRIAAFISFAYVILFVSVSALQGMKKPMFALYMGAYRQVVAPVIIFPILIAFFGIEGVWWGIFIVVWSGVLLTLWYTRRTFSKLAVQVA
jgi:putative MATE family efflux protein